MPKLTGAEEKILSILSRGKTNKEIARALGVSPATVKRHLENILKKLQLRNRVEAAIYALSNAGCPRGSHPACPLEIWQRDLNFTDEKWAV